MENDYIALAEEAINSGNTELAKSLIPQMDIGSRFFIEALLSVSQSNIDAALTTIDQCINATRNPKSRDPVLEARAKMIRGLARTSIGEITEGGADLRWAMDRLSVISEGSDEHGIAILNVAAWHRQQSEIVMSLATHSEIARESTHSAEIVAISRQRVASIHAELQDFSTALRHYWTSWRMAITCGIDAIAEVSCLHILDIGLTDVNDATQRLAEQIANAVPKPRSEKSTASINPEDLREVLEWITPRSTKDLSREHRPDLSLIIEAHNILRIPIPELLKENSSSIQDPDVAKLLQ